MDLGRIRKTYEKAALDEADCAADPIQQFDRWMRHALSAGLTEPNAMTVATVGADNRPSTRIVLIKSYDADGIVWYTNYLSRKGRELTANPFAALQFHWVELERQVRIEGRVEKTSDAESDAYYASRPLPSRIGAWASEQSAVVPSRTTLMARAAEMALRHGLNPPRPPHWGGYRLRPDYAEFWQGRASRLHDRIVYRRQDEAWKIERLAP
jgi:pyridoxamine 5'-phosphate oxidase